ncbi:transglutaminase-like domain-containing protein [Microbulbifer sp. MLAF003]|uniref:transglutaminase-like domain-containing protein n=1 Tax=unclassified Microbulbifer TaxID=2619833 RepID=UPI0024ACBB9D|nr:transglutaminase-like domain-containing protein [Microbulbifer sp. MLAF003]WHI49229.1 transglutaminase-like domain-containing protein [Microbulbifer sp. MLAF003]
MKQFFPLLLTLLALNVNAQSVPFFAELSTELATDQPLPLADTIHFELVSPEAQRIATALLDWKGITVEHIKGESLFITMRTKPNFFGEVHAKHRENSFVIDLDEESTKEFTYGFTSGVSENWTLTELESYVDDYIEYPTYIHGFNIASVVATQRSGDCTEYAVLTTALARSLNLPARVVLGTVILEDKEQVTSFGHAWAEVWHKGQWHILDSALYRSNAVRHFYLPASELDKEGPGFSLSLMRSIQLFPQRIENIKAVKIN